MNELTEAGRCDGRITNGIKGIWYDTEAIVAAHVDHELAAIAVEHAE